MKKMILFVLVAVSACGSWNKPHPVNPNNGVWIKCEYGGWCERSHEVCGVKGHACNEKECCEVGDNGFVFSERTGTPQRMTDPTAQ